MTQKELEKQIYEEIETFLEDNEIGKMAFPSELSAGLCKKIASLIEQNKPTGEYLEKIYIKSEADLPKEKGFYETGIGIRAFNPEEKLIKPFQSDSVEFWMKCVDYYLRPVEQNPDCYEKEFVIWVQLKTQRSQLSVDGYEYIFDSKTYTLDGLYFYWLTEYKNKAK
jgi:hypothetical protein